MVALTDTEEESEPKAEHDEIGENAAEDKQAAGAEHEGRRPAAFAAVEAGGDEGPDLIENPGSGEEDGAQNGKLEPDDVEGLHGLDLDEVLFLITERFEGANGRLADEIPKLVGVKEAEPESDGHAHQGTDDAGAQFFQVFEERHAEHAVVLIVATTTGWGRRWRRSLAAATRPARTGSYGLHGDGRRRSGGLGRGIVRISILVAVEGVGRLDRRLGRHRLERREIRLQCIRHPRWHTSGWRRVPGRGAGRPLLLFGWIHALSVMFGRG